MQLWIVGQFREQTPRGNVWDFQGVFASRELAVAACQSPSYFIAPADLNEPIPDDAQEWPGCEYPLV